MHHIYSTRALRLCATAVVVVVSATLPTLGGCDLIPPEAPPPFQYLDVRLVQSRSDDPAVSYPTTTLAVGLRNISDRAIEHILLEFYLYDQDGLPLPEAGRNAVSAGNDVDFPSGAEIEVQQVIDDLLFFRLDEAPIVDGLAVVEVVFADGGAWIDALELYEYPRVVTAEAEVAP